MSNFCLQDTESIEFVSEAFKILSEQNRMKIFCLLWKKETLCVCEIVKALGLKQNLVSHHLGMFKRIWLVETERRSTNIYYALDEEIYIRLKNTVWEIFNF